MPQPAHPAPPLSIGIVGGMSPESTQIYYQAIIRRHEEEFHDHSYPRMVVASVSFQRYIDWQHAGNWEAIARGLEREFEAVARAGADFALLAANTMHKVLPEVRSPVPVLNIMDAVAEHCRSQEIGTLGLTGTQFTMSDGFYQQGLERRGLAVRLPEPPERAALHEIIYRELILGRVTPESRQRFALISEGLLAKGCEAILLACTELGLLADESTARIPMIDTAAVHAHLAWAVAVGRRTLP